MNSIKSIIESVDAPKREKYNILTFPTHERYESQLCKTGHNFYSFSIDGNKEWNKKQTKPPENYYILPKNQLPPFIDIDFILVQSKFWQYQMCQRILQQIPVPVIVLEHTLPTPQTIDEQHIEQMRSMIGNVNIFISEFSANAWHINGDSHVLYHGVDCETFKPTSVEKQDHILTVANDFKKRDFCLNYSGWERITQGMKTKLIGEENGPNSIVCDNVDDLTREYNSCQIYLNTTTLSPIPMSLLEAMACGCAVVSTATCMIPEVIQNGINGYISNDEEELKSFIKNLQESEELRKKIGENARTTIQNMFSEEDFIHNWNSVFDKVYEAKQT